jgi:hypothetical protein
MSAVLAVTLPGGEGGDRSEIRELLAMMRAGLRVWTCEHHGDALARPRCADCSEVRADDLEQALIEDERRGTRTGHA